MLNFKLLNIFITFMILFACAEKNQKANHRFEKNQVKQETSFSNGLYKGNFKIINPLITPKIRGSVTIVNENDELTFTIRISRGPVRTLLIQGLHMGRRCPDQTDDSNDDYTIDAVEAFRVSGGVLIPLDDDLTSQRVGLGIFPVTDNLGNYIWSRQVRFESLVADLNEQDINPDDDFIKLPAGKKFDAEGLVVIISGVEDKTILLPTVVGRGRLSPQQSLPIACAVITKVKSIPGRVEEDETNIPLPGRETGADQPAEDDGADFSSETEETTDGKYGEEENDEV
jgi:hypothetical protein